jgi:GDPmannose 4,6-dehydratase
MKKKALICGVSGQDGSYLARLLLSKNYDVWGTSRDKDRADYKNLMYLGIKDEITYLTVNPEEFSSIYQTLLSTNFDEVYYLAGQSSVSLSFKEPSQTIKSIVLGTLNILESCRILSNPPRIYFAGSSECFGDTFGVSANESTPFHPQSPYAVAKSSAYWLVNNYRSSYGLFVCTGILFNHESPLRPNHFVTKKIIKAASRISKGSSEYLELGRLDISRDWGLASEFVEAMWHMLQLNQADDFVISTGQTTSLKEFVIKSFEFFGLNSLNYIKINPDLIRPSDITVSLGDSSKAYKTFGWKAKVRIDELIKIMASDSELN